MRLIFLCVLIAATSAQFQRRFSPRRPSFPSVAVVPTNIHPTQRASVARAEIPIVNFRSEGPDVNGRYDFGFQTGNGITRDQRGDPLNPSGAVTKNGGWSYTSPDGSPVTFTFEADEFGYRPSSNLLPALPDFVLAQIRHAEEERARGVRHGGDYEPHVTRARTPSVRPAPVPAPAFRRNRPFRGRF